MKELFLLDLKMQQFQTVKIDKIYFTRTSFSVSDIAIYVHLNLGDFATYTMLCFKVLQAGVSIRYLRSSLFVYKSKEAMFHVEYS